MTVAPPHPPPEASDPNEVDAIDEMEPPQSLKSKVLQPRWRTKSLHEQRFDLARMLLFVVAGLAGALLVGCIFVPIERLEAIQSLAPVIFGPLVTLFGTSVAWYYATDAKSDKGDKGDNLQ